MFALKELTQTENLESEIHEIFLKRYKHTIQHKNRVTFEEILISSFSQLGIEHGGLSFPQLEKWFDKIYNMSFFKGIITDCTEEIIFHSPFKLQKVSKRGKQMEDIEHLSLVDDYSLILETLCQKCSIDWNTKNPFVSFKTIICGNQFRVTLIHKSTLATNSHKAFFRMQNNSVFPIDSYTSQVSFIERTISEKQNVLISGSTGSGKTSFMKSLLNLVDRDDHIILMEDTEELANSFENITCMLSKDMDGYSLKNYCEYSMRMRPDRLILGEMRSHEVVPFLLSMNNGHKGLMSTIHANNAHDAILRSALLFEFYNESKSITYEQILKLISKDLDYVIHMENKNVVEIIKVIGFSNQQVRYEVIYSSKSQA